MNLNRLATSTFLGGDGSSRAHAIDVDRAGSIYVTGQTTSVQFPTTPGTFDTTNNGFNDGFISKLNNSGTDLIYSTYFGGNVTDLGYEIKVDASGNAFVAGRADSSNFPTTAGVFQTTKSVSADAFVLKLNDTGSSLIYSTYVGGQGFDEARALDIDSSGNAYLQGQTNNNTFPTTGGVFDTSHNGGTDVFVTKVNADATALVYSTFIGGDGTDTARGIAVDESGNAYITGSASDSTTDFPTTPSAFQSIHQGNTDVYITKLNPTASALVYSTFLGGTNSDSGGGIDINSAGNAFVAGSTFSTNFPTTTGTIDETANGASDVFVTKFNSTGSSLSYSTYIGGSSTDEGNGIAVDNFGNAFVTGRTFDGTTDYPTTTGAFDTTHNTSTDVFVSKVNVLGNTLLNSTFIGGDSLDDAYAIAVDQNGNSYVTGDTRSSNYPTTADVYQADLNGVTNLFISKLGDNSIAGKTLDISGNPLPNTAVAMSGGVSDFMLSDTNGYFGFTDTRQNGTHLITATQLLYNFNPPNYERVYKHQSGNKLHRSSDNFGTDRCLCITWR